ncbi:fungal-specific transcription factor domain-containing protein [Aspergillus granulosus]|uniref:Fungal-specific transcription factor domain-containing protein n=1 Tax=Aspergillus granulosus TaxID=176169 RepID=A0ABR4GU39_9EURO
MALTRSCYRCSQKKIRCSKGDPCTSCVKTNSECVFPAPGRAPRRKKRPLKAELASRLSALEHEFQNLTNNSGNLILQDNTRELRGEHGKLLVDEASTYYVTHEVLVRLGNQIGELKHSTEAPSNTGDHEDTPSPRDETAQHGSEFMFGYSSTALSLQGLHPSKEHSHILWQAFEQNVAPVVMIFHKPTLRTLIHDSTANTEGIHRDSEAVVFAVYFAAIASMDPDECKQKLGQDYASLTHRFKFATQQALARSGFLRSPNLAILQAATLFLTCLRRPEDTYFVWTMTAAVHRTAQGLGLHRDGASFGLSPFEVEMRRRLWWSIYLLDSQSSELHGMNPLITEQSYDTRLPQNINDSSLSPESVKAPDPSPGFTEMTFCLVRCEMTSLYRQAAPGSHSDISSSDDSQSLAHLSKARLHQLDQIHTQLVHSYLRFCDVTVPVQWVTATIIRLALARSWVIAHLSHEAADKDNPGHEEVPPDDRIQNQLFSTAMEVVEFAYLLETDPRTRRWSWLFEGYPQWQAVVFILTELCARPHNPAAERACALIVTAFSRWIDTDARKGNVTPKIVFGLMDRAAELHGFEWRGHAKEVLS